MRKTIFGVGALSFVALAGCAAMNPQGAARQNAEVYYGRPYEQLSAQEKIQLENHLADQSNTAWHTSAHVASGVGRLLQGVGVLIFSAR